MDSQELDFKNLGFVGITITKNLQKIDRRMI